jgi:hypothetical protein
LQNNGNVMLCVLDLTNIVRLNTHWYCAFDCFCDLSNLCFIVLGFKFINGFMGMTLYYYILSRFKKRRWFVGLFILFQDFLQMISFIFHICWFSYSSSLPIKGLLNLLLCYNEPCIVYLYWLWYLIKFK